MSTQEEKLERLIDEFNAALAQFADLLDLAENCEHCNGDQNVWDENRQEWISCIACASVLKLLAKLRLICDKPVFKGYREVEG